MKSDPTPLSVAVVNLVFDEAPDGVSLVSRWPTLTRFSESLASRPGTRVRVLQRFARDEDFDLGSVEYRLRADGVDSLPGLTTRIPKLSALLREWSPDVVHINGFSFPAQLAALLIETGRRPVFVIQHHAGAPDAGFRGLLQRLVTPLADGFLFTAAGIAAPWRRQGVLGKKPVLEVVEGSCDFTPVERSAARATTKMDGNPAVLWVGRLHSRKDPMTALRGFAFALDRLPGATLTMVFGEAPLLPEVESFAAGSPPLAGRIRLVGRIPHAALPAWYSAADLFLTSSPDEGSNYALIESMACGGFPVASDIPPHRLLTDGDGVGELFPPGDAEACARALCRAAPRATTEARSAVRRRFEDVASWTAIAGQADRAYRTLIEARVTRRSR